MKIKELIDYLQQKQKEGYTEINVCLDGYDEYHICNVVDSQCEDADGNNLLYVSLMVNTEETW